MTRTFFYMTNQEIDDTWGMKQGEQMVSDNTATSHIGIDEYYWWKSNNERQQNVQCFKWW